MATTCSFVDVSGNTPDSRLTAVLGSIFYRSVICSRRLMHLNLILKKLVLNEIDISIMYQYQKVLRVVTIGLNKYY